MGYVSPKKQKYSIELAVEVAQKIDSGEMTYRGAQKAYNITSQGTVWTWVKYYREGRLTLPPMLKNMHNMGESKEIIAWKLQQTEDLLEKANLQIETLRTLISIAEEELKVDIRKKSFTQQSKK